MAPTYSAPSVRQLAALVERVAPRDPAQWDDRERVPGAGGVLIQVSRQRADQLWMVIGMYDRAVGREEMPGRASRTAEQLFTWAALRAFWGLAVSGELRFLAKDRGRELPVASQRTVRDCLGMLARLAVPGKAVRLPALPNVETKQPVARRSLDALYRGLVDMAGAGPLERDGTALTYEDRTRTLAMLAILLDAAPRSGELAALRLDDLTDGEAAVGVRRRQQKGAPTRADEIAALAEVHPETVRFVLGGWVERVSEATRQRVLAAIEELGPAPEVEWYALREGSQVAVRRWLKVREGLVESLPLTGARTALWVTLVPSKAGPPGVPLRAQGLRAAYARGVTALNFVMAGSYGWEPLPVRMEQVRRAVEAVPLGARPG
ncbi:LacI family DNA-binding transcriptional regulator [Streptomyces sp. NPDC047985]|uniref:LacI family DNA-binding transcriptional regulator n=1 Tax=Streptomyces sp. NPDC047985 TaxID=3155384 RepID=UPI003428F47D